MLLKSLSFSLRKDNSNLHTKNLFIGSEGQFGIITQVIVSVPNRPQNVNSIFLDNFKLDFNFFIYFT